MLPFRIALAALAVLSAPATEAQTIPAQASDMTRTDLSEADLVGMWVTENGHIRLELLAGGRYDEARGARRSAYAGRWEIRGPGEIFFADDSGFTATGTVADGTLEVGGDRFRRDGRWD
ncbi:Atu4866 domain-containing protein [Inquilinus sp. Marseille-Q2685]|uniref:Atu4866 domain-containing protein n=1 Tax=Inquilinus sp. Marseille-Q2685 TaxID=2866581 RepID=UPI001CE45BB1|nr:Atu4866 domain-containing protein [Inquilinus sp. Marseille-Q2685]